jgi:hypothetical protein
MMNDSFMIWYCALSGLDSLTVTLSTGLHPVLTDSALSGLMRNATDSVGSESFANTFFIPKLE